MIKIKSKLWLFPLLLTLLTVRAFAIDPDLIYAEQFGGSADDFGWAIVVDKDGNSYITGYTLSDDFPTTPGAYNPASNGGSDVFIVKFDPVGNLVYSTYFGGNGTDYGEAIAVNSAGYLYITGVTSSSDLPLTSGGCNGIADGFLAIFDPQGNLVHCQYFGESGVDYGRGIAIDYYGNVYVVGYSQGDSSGDAFIAKFGPMGGLIFFIPFGGSEEMDPALGVAIDYKGDIYVIGETFCSVNEFLIDGFPFDPSVFDGVFDNTYNGLGDVFIAKFNSLGILLRFTFLGGPFTETGFAIDVNQEGVYVTGCAFNGFPTTSDAYCPGNNGNYDVFVSKLDPTLTSLKWSTFVGGRTSDYGFGIKVDSKGYPWIIGHTYSDNFPTTANAFDRDYNGEADVIIARLDPSGRILVYATYSGGLALDSGRGIALNEVDEDIHVCIGGHTESPKFLASFAAYNTDNDRGDEIFVAKILFPSVANLFISTTAGGTTNPEPGTYTYDEGIEVSITAIPDSGYQFSGWTGSVSGTTNPITITMDSDKSITASFTAISTGDGDGSGDGSGDGKKGGCFIATAAYGSPLHPHLNILRDFRDKYLISNKPGHVLVDFYYKHSPLVADLIARNKALKVAVRISLFPFVAFSYSMLHLGPIITAIMLVLIFMVPIFLISFFRRELRRLEAKDPKALASLG